MSNTLKLNLPHILTAQAQKEVTHNDALNLLDIFTRPTVLELAKNAPPVSPSAGDCYIVGASPTDAFAGHEQEIACYTDNGWLFAAPFKWLDVVNEADGTRYIFNGTAWVQYGFIQQDSGEYLRIERLEETITILSGASVDSTLEIPNRATVLAVNTRVTSAITGATSFDLGVTGDTARYGDNVSIALDTTNIGLTQHPHAYYANTPLTLTANGGNFSAGEVNVVVHFITSRGAWNF